MVAELRCSTTSAEMAEYMQRVREQSSELFDRGMNLLSLAYKNAVGSRRAAWRVITSTEQKEKFKGKEELVLHAMEYVARAEGELQKIRDGILVLMDKNLIPSPNTDELKMFYYKMKGDYYRHLAEVATGETKSKASEDACVAYAEAIKIAEKDMVMAHPIRLAMALSSLDEVSVVAQRQIPIGQTVQKTVENPQLQRTNRVIDGPVVQVEHIPQSHVAEKTVEIPQLDVIEKIVETPEIQTGHSIQGRFQQRSLEQIVDTPIPQVVAEAPKDFSQNRVQQSSMEQTIANQAISLAEETVEMPVHSDERKDTTCREHACSACRQHS